VVLIKVHYNSLILLHVYIVYMCFSDYKARYTLLVSKSRVHGPWTRCPKWHPCSRAVDTTRGPR